MARVKDLDQCQFYACKNPQHDDPSGDVTVQIEGEDEPVKVLSCLYHAAIAGAGSDKYLVGRTFRNEIELRPVTVKPFTPTEEPA